MIFVSYRINHEASADAVTTKPQFPRVHSYQGYNYINVYTHS